MLSHSVVSDSETSWTVARQAPLLPVSLIPPPACLPLCHMALLSTMAEQEGLRGQEDVWVLPLRLFWEPKLGLMEMYALKGQPLVSQHETFTQGGPR